MCTAILSHPILSYDFRIRSCGSSLDRRCHVLELELEHVRTWMVMRPSEREQATLLELHESRRAAEALQQRQLEEAEKKSQVGARSVVT